MSSHHPSQTKSAIPTTQLAEAAEVTPEEIVRQLRAVRDQIPEFEQLPSTDTASLRRVANIDPDFVQASISALGASESLQTALGRTADELRLEHETAGRWASVEDELNAMLKGVSTGITVRRHRAGLTALQTYNMSRQLVRQREHAGLLPHVDHMKRLNKFGRRRSKAVPEPPPQTPEPQVAH